MRSRAASQIWLFWDPCFGENFAANLLIEKEKIDWLIISTMATDGAEFMSNYGRSVLIPIGYEIMYERKGGRRIFLSETENEFTRRKLRNHETPRYW